MNLVKIEAHVDVANPKQIEALNNFLTAIGNEATIETKDTPTPVKKTRKPEKVEEIEVKEAEEVSATVVEDEAQDEDAPVAKEVTIDITEVRALLATKVGAHRDAIKKELEKLDAKNVTSLKPESYPAFMGFLKALS